MAINLKKKRDCLQSSSDSGSFTSGLAGGHLYHLYSTFLDNLR